MKKATGTRPSKRAVLLLGNARQSLTVIRTLRRHGWAPIVGVRGTADRNNHSHLSRDVAGVWRHVDWRLDRQAFARALHRFIRERSDIAAIFPVNGEAVHHIHAMRGELPDTPTIVLPNDTATALCLDKQATHELCGRLSIPVASYHVVQARNEIRSAVDTLGLPCLIKPLDKAELVFGMKAAIIRDKSALEGWLGDERLDNRKLMVQQFVDYARYNVNFAARRGRLIAAVAVVTNRTDRVDGTGFTVSGTTVEPPAPVREECEQLVRALDYTGVGCAQWLVGADGKDRVFLELNPRLAGSVGGAEQAGAPLSLLALRLARNENVTQPEDPWASYKRGYHYAWTTGALAGCRFEFGTKAIGTGTALNLVRLSVAEALRAHAHSTWSWRDPVPTTLEWMRPLMGRSKRLLSSRTSGDPAQAEARSSALSRQAEDSARVQ